MRYRSDNVRGSHCSDFSHMARLLRKTVKIRANTYTPSEGVCVIPAFKFTAQMEEIQIQIYSSTMIIPSTLAGQYD